VGWNGSTLSRHLVTPAHVKTRRGATALGASGQTQSALPCRPGNSLVAQGEVPSIGNGAMRQVFFTARGIFFALLLIFPFRQEKSGAQMRIKEACHKIYLAIRRSGDFFTGRSEKHTTCGSMKQKRSPATSRIGAAPSALCRRGKQRDEKALLRLLEAFLPQDPGAGCEAAQDSGRDPQPGTAFFPKKAGGDFPQQEKPPPLSSTSY